MYLKDHHINPNRKQSTADDDMEIINHTLNILLKFKGFMNIIEDIFCPEQDRLYFYFHSTFQITKLLFEFKINRIGFMISQSPRLRVK